jgi:hypothetical protein
MAPIDALRNRARDEPGVDQSYDDRHELSKVLLALRALSRSDREALLLRAAGELSFEFDVHARWLSRISPRVAGVSSAADSRSR